jgi:MFS transporter, DHA1 family, tetracycline resistance protein
VAGLCAVNYLLAYFFLKESLLEKNTDARFKLNFVEDFQAALQKPVVREIFWFSLVYIIAFAMMQTTLALMWKNHDGLTDEQSSYAFAFMGVTAAVVQGGLISWLNRRFGERQLLFIGTGLMFAGLVILPLVPRELFIPFELLALALVALANGCLSPTLISILSKNTAPQEQGHMLGLNQSFGSLARAIGPIVGGFLYDFEFFLPYFAGALLMIVCGMVANRLSQPKAMAIKS